MTASINTGVDAAFTPRTDWSSINWPACLNEVKKLQARIAKAVREGSHCKVKALQWLLTHSFSAKALAVRRVVENKGKNTPGVDGVTWSSPAEKSEAILLLKRCGYQPKSLRRVYISKSKGKRRPLSIPVKKDLAMQALHKLVLETERKTADQARQEEREGVHDGNTGNHPKAGRCKKRNGDRFAQSENYWMGQLSSPCRGQKGLLEDRQRHLACPVDLSTTTTPKQERTLDILQVLSSNRQSQRRVQLQGQSGRWIDKTTAFEKRCGRCNQTPCQNPRRDNAIRPVV